MMILKLLLEILVTAELIFQVQLQDNEKLRLENSTLTCGEGFRCVTPSRCREEAFKLIQGRPLSCSSTSSPRRLICCPLLNKQNRAAQPVQRLHTTSTTTSAPTPSLLDRARLDCGKAGPSIGRQIPIGESEMGSWPWMGYDYNGCSLFLITRKHLLGTAFCIEYYKKTIQQVSIGDLGREISHRYNVVTVDIPSGYSFGEIYDDLAIITLAEEVDATPICLPLISDYNNLFGLLGTVVGFPFPWNECNFVSARPEQQSSPWRVISNWECSSILKEENRGDEKLFCAYSPNNRTCDIDASSPLMFRKRNRWYAEGIMLSYDWRQGSLFLFTRISDHMDWIREVIERQ